MEDSMEDHKVLISPEGAQGKEAKIFGEETLGLEKEFEGLVLSLGGQQVPQMKTESFSCPFHPV